MVTNSANNLIYLTFLICSCLPPKRDSCIDIAFHYETEKRHELAISTLSSCIETASISSRAKMYLIRGRNYHQLSEYDLAIRDYNSSIELDSNQSGAYYYRGVARFHMGDDSGAVVDFNRSLANKSLPTPGFYVDKTDMFDPYRLEVESYVIKYDRGISNYNIQQFDQSLEDFIVAESHGYKLPEVFYNIGLIYFIKEDRLTACRYMKKAAELRYKDAEPYLLEYCR
ncbi:MAG TPA: tetratricopeptide repeat protein [Chitinophagaceae bacterium]